MDRRSFLHKSDSFFRQLVVRWKGSSRCHAAESNRFSGIQKQSKIVLGDSESVTRLSCGRTITKTKKQVDWTLAKANWWSPYTIDGAFGKTLQSSQHSVRLHQTALLPEHLGDQNFFGSFEDILAIRFQDILFGLTSQRPVATVRRSDIWMSAFRDLAVHCTVLWARFTGVDMWSIAICRTRQRTKAVWSGRDRA